MAQEARRVRRGAKGKEFYVKWIDVEKSASHQQSRSEIGGDDWLLDSFKRPAVTASPVGTLWAGFSFGVIDSFFVRTADDAVCNYNRPNSLCFDECSDQLSDTDIRTYIGILREPALKRIGFEVFLFEDADCDFRGGFYSRPVEGYGRDRVSTESLLYLSVQPR